MWISSIDLELNFLFAIEVESETIFKIKYLIINFVPEFIYLIITWQIWKNGTPLPVSFVRHSC